jgi:hypothetical protein
VEITEVAGGRPLDDLGGGAVSAEVSFGSERVTLPLERAAGRGHELRAWLLPTRPGTYTFRIVGKIKTQAIDITSTCSAKTFDCVADVTAIQFPSKDPSIGQIADRLDRSLPRAEQASSTAAEARTVAFIAVAIAVFAQVSALVLGFRRARKGS